MVIAFLSSILTLTTLYSLSVQVEPSLALDHQQLGGLQAQTANTEWPSLRFYFTIKRSSMKLHGQSSFSVFARPILSDSNGTTNVLYDTFTSFAQGSTSYNYITIDGVAYVSRSSPETGTPLVQCVNSVAVPSINSFVAALSEATSVSSISANNGSAIECSSGSNFKVTVNGVDFGVCASGSSGFTIYGSDIDITVEYLSSHVEILPPIGIAGTTGDCKVMSVPTSVSTIGRSLLTGEPVSLDSKRMLKAAIDFSLDDEKCSSKSKPRPCIFIHGLGIRKEEPQNADERPKYWGDLTDHAPCCSSMKYAVLDTIKYAWTDKTQQQKVCDRMLAVSETSRGTTVSDTIIISHSMGGLMVAGAIATGTCSLASSSTWISTASPMTGSMSSDYFQDSCKDDTILFMEIFVDLTGLCPAGDGIQSLAYQNETYSSKKLDAAYVAAQTAYRRNVYALMCSNQYAGIYSIEHLQYRTLGNVVPHKSDKNDGMVEFQSCAAGIPESKFGNSYRDRFYATNLNHADAAFRHGDSLLDTTKMPVKWFECLL
ncbi:hypothetical protein F442_01360 [Phytophthora nicotianae P10297]|uniref:GPI inositol-deacylase n=1 Tax=Phytophthora nicotianae P10297 TaxID=1317064 RepID=W3A3H9_PHYNI|nr:hypothetical protein F442_01360 [Phytophthora nicotianae P10297]